MERIMRPRTVDRVPKENRWADNSEFVTGVPWKLNKDHEPGEEVLLDIVPPAPPSHPSTTVLPPAMSGDLDPDEPGGIGYTGGRPGCKALIKGTTATGHNDDCRRRVGEKISQCDPGNARVKAARTT